MTTLVLTSLSALYMLLMEHLENFTQKVESCVNNMIARKTFRETGVLASKVIGGTQVFGALATVLYQYVSTYRQSNKMLNYESILDV